MTDNKIKALISKLWSTSGPGDSCSTCSSGLSTVFLQTSHTTRDHVACCAEEAAKGMTKARSLRSKGYLGRSRSEQGQPAHLICGSVLNYNSFWLMTRH